MALKFNLVDGMGKRQTRVLATGTLSIGRSERNDWVLPDPERHLSKTHCVISLENGCYVLTDLSANGVFINGAQQPTTRDSRITLTDGDEFRLGDYRISVEEIAMALPDEMPAGGNYSAGNDPLDIDLLDDPLGRPPDPSFSHPITPVPMTRRQEDPFDRADTGSQGPIGDEDLFSGRKPASNWSGPSQPDHADAPRHAMPVPRRVTAANPQAVDFDALDALIGDLSIQPHGRVAQPSPLATPAPAPQQASPAAAFDDLLPPASPVDTTPPAEAWPPAGRAASPAERKPSPGPPPQAPDAQAARREMADGVGPEAMRAALSLFLQGAGVPQNRAPDDPEATLRHLGHVFRALTEGVREVLMSRAAVKGELRVEQTLLKSNNNNPLKFSFSTEEAMMALLQTGRPGYMPPLAAAREAFDDIKMHELAVMAGVQTALINLLHRFDPEALEVRLQQGMLVSMLPAARKARLWDRFRELYKTIATESEDDFQAVFGRGFAKAYKAQTRKE